VTRRRCARPRPPPVIVSTAFAATDVAFCALDRALKNVIVGDSAASAVSTMNPRRVEEWPRSACRRNRLNDTLVHDDRAALHVTTGVSPVT
jgi:hypothetical protein